MDRPNISEATPPPVVEAWARLVRSLGGRVGVLTSPLIKLPTGIATWLQLLPDCQAMRVKHEDFVGGRWGLYNHLK